MTRMGARWMSLLSVCGVMALPSWADDRRASEESTPSPYRVPVRGFQWHFGPGGSKRAAPANALYPSALFSRNSPWGTNEYLIIGASVVATVVIIVLATDHHHDDDPPRP